MRLQFLGNKRVDDGLAALKIALMAEVDAEAGKERLRYISTGEGQEMVYVEKEKEALRVLANSSDIGGHIALEATRLGVSNESAADLILFMADQWRQVSPLIEDVRLRTKDAIQAATSVTAARQARNSAEWP